MSDGFPEYKALQKQIDEQERRIVGQAQELSRLRAMATTTRDDLSQLKTAMLGNDTLGMSGLIDRLEQLERSLTKVWWSFIVALALGALLNVTTLFMLVKVMERL